MPFVQLCKVIMALKRTWRFARICCLCKSIVGVGHGEVMEHWLRDQLFWARSLAGGLTGTRPCLCDVFSAGLHCDLRDSEAEKVG